MKRPRIDNENVLLWAVVIVAVASFLVAIFSDAAGTTIATVAYTALTALLVIDSRFTRGIMRQELTDSENARQAADRPLVIAYFVRRRFMADLVIENVGSAPATEVRFTFSNRVNTESFGDSFWEMALLTDGISFMSPGMKIQIPFDSLFNLFGKQEENDTATKLIVKAEAFYQHALFTDRTYSNSLHLDVEYLRGSFYSSKEDPSYTAANHLEGINKSIARIEKTIKAQ